MLRPVLAMVLALALAFTLALPEAQAQTRPRPRPPNPQIPAPQPDTEPSQAPRPKPRPEGQADQPAQGKPARAPIRGAVTNLPLPRYVTLKGAEGNARRGPGLSHRIDWVYTTKGTPLRVTAEYENWRRVEDFEGFGGWIHFRLLSMARGVIVTSDMAQVHKLPDANSPLAFVAERGVLAWLLECQIDWCRVNADGQRGWVIKTAIWGVDPDEVVE